MFDIGGVARLVVANKKSAWCQRLPALALWHHLGYTHSLPWPLKLRVEVDGVLESQVHEVVMRREDPTRRTNGATVTCAAAFFPLAGMLFVAWRFMQQTSTLVFAVRTHRRGVAAKTPAPDSTQHATSTATTAATTTTIITTSEEEESSEDSDEEEEEVEESQLSTLPVPAVPGSPLLPSIQVRSR